MAGRLQLTIGRSFLLWLLGVLVVTLVLVSALVLWHERGVLEGELRNQSLLLARTLAVAAVEGGSPEFLAVISIGDLRAGEVRRADGELLWRYGPPLDEAAALEGSLVRVAERVEAGSGERAPGGPVDVVLLVSRTRIDRLLAASAVRLVTALAVALALALLVGLDLVGRLVRPLRALTDSVRLFRPEQPGDLPAPDSAIVEVGDLSRAFRDMAVRLADQQRSLAANERRFRDLFASSPTPLLELGEDRRIRGANPATTPFLGCEPGQALGRSVAEFLEDADDGALERAVESSRSVGEAVVEARWRLADGELAEVELHLRPSAERGDPGHLMAIHDLTDRVRRLGERWRRTFDAMMDGVALVDQTGEIVRANQALSRHLPELRPVVAEQLREGGSAEWRMSSDDRLLQCSLSTPSELGHSILVARDITDAVRAESRLREAEKMQAVGTLASGVAHDFNNLLAAIELHVRWLERDPGAAAEAGAAIRDLASEGIEVVRELLLFARRESTPPRTIDLSSLVAGQEAVLRHLMPAQVELRLRVEATPVPVVGNPVALRRLLLNLVLNARDAVAAAGGWVEVEVGAADGRATVSVADNGTGFPPEHRDRLFEPFFSLRRHGRGAGLGLAVVYAIATEHGGDVEVSSDGRSGSRFSVRLPLGEVCDLEPHGGHGGDAGLDVAERVLLVDDDGREAARLVEALAAAGIDVRHATSLEAARGLAAAWSPTAVVAVADLPDGSAAPWLGELEVPAVVLVVPTSTPGAVAPVLPPRALALERGAAPESVLAGLQRVGLRVVR